MKQICRFCKGRDVGKVIQGLAPDINQMLKTHVVPNAASDVVYNQLMELEQVGVRINDDFDMLMIARGLKQLTNEKGALNPNGGTGSSQGPTPVAPSGVTSVSE